MYRKSMRQMKVLKFLYFYYCIIIITPVIYLIRTFWGDRLENELYFKQHGNLLKRCLALPSFIVIPLLLFMCAGLFLWTKKIKENANNTNNVTSNNYFELAVITLFIILFIFLDFGMLQLLIALIK